MLLKNDGVLPLAASDSLYVAGSNADDLGHQMGGWTISWQGGSGDITTGTSILEGIRQVDADATFSKDASAPMDGADTGIVVVGEAPYAEGQGDVGNNGKSLSLSAADRTAIDRVCAAMDCVVLVVAGRTQLVTDQLAEIDGLVASFLPGSEGAGVADVLFGVRAVHRPPACDLARDGRAGADQRRRLERTSRCSPTAGACARMRRATGSPTLAGSLEAGALKDGGRRHRRRSDLGCRRHRHRRPGRGRSGVGCRRSRAGHGGECISHRPTPSPR